MSTMVASTPLQPDSIDTAKPVTESRRIRPLLITESSKGTTMAAESHARPAVNGCTTLACTGLSNSMVKRPSKHPRNMIRKRLKVEASRVVCESLYYTEQHTRQQEL